MKSCKRGQTTIEFALTLILVFGFGFMIFQLSMVFAVGSYIQYATFMSARAYLSAGPDEADQNRRATIVLQGMVKKGTQDRWPSLAKGEGQGSDVVGAQIGQGTGYQTGARDLSWLEGVRYGFRSRVFLVPMGRRSERNTLILHSESWLGREPTRTECESFLKESIGEEQLILDNDC